MTNISSIKTLTAANQLRDLLSHLDNFGSLSSSPESSSPKYIKEKPNSDEFNLFLQATNETDNQLRNENRLLFDDNAKLRSRIIILIEENNRLHEEIRNTFVSDILGLINLDDDQAITIDKEIMEFYTKQMRRLEIELKDTKEKLNSFENVLNISNDSMICPNCGKPNAMIYSDDKKDMKYSNMTIENELNKCKLQQMQVKLEQIQMEEQRTLTKLKETLAVVEKCQFDQAEAIIERDQIKNELMATEKRLKMFIDEMNEKIMIEKKNAESLCQAQLNDYVNQIKTLEEKCLERELTIERLSREKCSLQADLDIWKERIQREEINLIQTTDSATVQLQKAMRERDQANSNAMTIRSDFEKLLLQSNQDLMQLRQQLSVTQNQLNDTENELLNSKKQFLNLTEETNGLTRENIMLKNTKQNLEQSREESINAAVVLLNKYENDFRQVIEKVELERHQSLSYLEDLVCRQNLVLNKLRSYSRRLTREIEIIIEQIAKIDQETKSENQTLRIKLANAYGHLEKTNVQLLQHREIHMKLKKRLVDLNSKVKEYESIMSKTTNQSPTDQHQKRAVNSRRILF